MRVAFDTNVLVSAFLTPRGIAGTLLNDWEAGVFELVISPYILDELDRILVQKIKLNRSKVDTRIKLFYHTAWVVEPLPMPAIHHIDDQDLPVLGTALAGHEISYNR